MREIKFRAWHKADGMRYDVQKGIQRDTYLQGIQELINAEKNDLGWFVMQYTGLKDKNGVEIFESDLVDWDGDVYEVRFNEGEWQLFNSGDMEGDRPSLYRISSPKQSRMVIVGNVYENKTR